MPKAGYGNGFNNQALPRAAGLAKEAGIPAEEAIEAILDTQDGASRNPAAEVRSTIDRIYADNGTASRPAKRRKPWPSFDPKEVEKVLLTSPLTLEELVQQSPEQNLDARPTSEFLRCLFPSGQLITVGARTNSAEAVGDASFMFKTLLLDNKTADDLRVQEFVVPSPAVRRRGKRMDGQPSAHSKDMYGHRHHIVFESDKLSKDANAAVLMHLAQFAPLVMIVDSGNKSLHGWFDCEGMDEKAVELFFSYAIRLGADPKMADVWQLARMPNGTRLGGARQSVLYWDPKAKGREWNLSKLPGNTFVVRSICDIPDDESDESNLIGDRFLCRGKCVLLVGATGIGKSTFVMQMAVRFALGRDLFGLMPQKPLDILIVQAENDAKEMQEMVSGALEGTKATEEEKELINNRVFYVTLNPNGEWLSQVGRAVEEFKIDLVVLDPLFAYVRGNVSEQETMSQFLRGQIQPFLEQHQIGLILCHHVNKPASSKKDRADWKGGDFAYSGSGSAEIANWCKGVLALRSIGSHDVFELVVGKRHKRAGFRNRNGDVVDRLAIRHSTVAGVLYWELADEEDAVSDDERSKLVDLALVFLEIQKQGEAKIVDVAEKMGRAKRTVDRLFQGGKELFIPGAGDRPALKLARVCGQLRSIDLPPKANATGEVAGVGQVTVTATLGRGGPACAENRTETNQGQ